MSVITKVHSLRGDVSKAIDYIINDEKTEPWLIGTNYGVVPEYVGMYWKNKWKEEGYRGDTVGYHFIQSFDDPDLKPEQIYELANEWIERCTKGKHDYVIAVHKNTNHTHAHIIVNPVNRETKKGWSIYYKKELKEFRKINDQICEKYGLEILPPSEKVQSNSWWKFQNRSKGDTDMEVIRKAIDYVVPRVKDYNDFKLYLNKIGFEVEDGSTVERDSNDLIDRYKNYRFNVNVKMINTELSNGDYYFVRIPYSKEWMLIDRENTKWNDRGDALECQIDFTKTYNIYNSNGDKVVEYDRDGINIASVWENMDKESKGRQGLRIKPPYRSRFRRCKKIINPENESLDYSLEGILSRIKNNGCYVTDLEIEDVIKNDKLDSNKQKDIRNTFYDNAEIKTAFNQSPLYRMNKKEKYYFYKTKDIQEKLDMIAKRKESFENVGSLDEMKKLKRDIHRELVKCNSRIREIELSFEEIQIQRMEGILEMTDAEVSNLIDDDLSHLKKEAFKLKHQYSDITNKIKNAEKDKDKFR